MPKSSRPALGPSSLYSLDTIGAFSGVQAPKCEAEHFRPSGAVMSKLLDTRSRSREKKKSVGHIINNTYIFHLCVIKDNYSHVCTEFCVHQIDIVSYALFLCESDRHRFVCTEFCTHQTDVVSYAVSSVSIRQTLFRIQ